MSRSFLLFPLAILLTSCAASPSRVSEPGTPATLPPPESIQGDNVVAIAMTSRSEGWCRRTAYDRQKRDDGNGQKAYGPWRLVSDEVHRIDGNARSQAVDPCDDHDSSQSAVR